MNYWAVYVKEELKASSYIQIQCCTVALTSLGSSSNGEQSPCWIMSLMWERKKLPWPKLKEKKKRKSWIPSDHGDRKLYDSHSLQRPIIRAGGFCLYMWVFEYSGGEGLFSIEIMTHSPSLGKLPSDELQNSNHSNLPMYLTTCVTTLDATVHPKNIRKHIKLYFCFTFLIVILQFTCSANNTKLVILKECPVLC